MINGLLQTICRIGIFMICAQAVVHFRPQAAYEKYLKLLVSVMVLIQLLFPVSRILFHGDGDELERKTQAFLEGLEAEMSAAESRAFEADALLEQMTLEELRRRAEEAEADSEDSVTGGGRAEDSMTGSGRTEDSVTGNGAAEAGEQQGASSTIGGAVDNDTVRIDRIQVGEIQVQFETGSPE